MSALLRFNKGDRPLIGIMRVIGDTFALPGRIMLDMQVIEALYLKDEEPHDYLHIKQERTLPFVV